MMILIYFLENVEDFERTFHIYKIILRFLNKFPKLTPQNLSITKLSEQPKTQFINETS